MRLEAALSVMMATPQAEGVFQPSARRASPIAAALVGSLVLHGAVLAALLLWPPGPLPEDPAAAGSVALVFADTVDLAGGAAAASEAEPAPESEPAPPAPPPAAAMPPAPEAPPTPSFAAAPPPPAPAPPLPPPPAPMAEAGILPPPPPPLAPEPAPEPPQEPAPVAEAPPPAPPAPPAQIAARAAPASRPAAPPRDPAPRGTPSPVRLDAGAGALPDPSLGARAIGAVVPPGADAGHRNAPPEYPAESRRRGDEGVVRLMLRVTATGQVEQADVIASSGHPALDRAAIDAARRWRFRPATQSGLAVPATLATAVHFRLTDAGGR